MNKFLGTVLLVIFGFISFSWNFENKTRASISKEEIISCMNTETVDAYIKEASTSSFASMHPSPKKIYSSDLFGKMIDFPVQDGINGKAYFIASKKKSKKWLLVIQEWWGLNDNIKNEGDKYYKDLGDVNILAVDMYDGKVASTPDSAMKYSRGADPVRMANIIKGAIQHAGKDASIYTVGWCFGGMWSLQSGILAGSQAKGIVMFYGRPESNIEKLKSIQCDVIGFFGNLDRSPSPAMVAEFENNMKTAGKNLVTYKYEAGHGFANPSNPNFNAAATEDSYAKAIAFLKSH